MRRFFSVLCVLACCWICGCASTKISDPRVAEARLDDVGDWKGKPLEVVVVSWNEYLTNQVEHSSTVYLYNDPVASILATAIDSAFTSALNNMEPKGSEVVFKSRSDRLIDAFEEAGLNGEGKADYYVSGRYCMTGIDSSSAGWIFWDIAMALPSLVLPVPIGGINDFSFEVMLYDANLVKIDSALLTDVEVRLLLYSAWSGFEAVDDRHDAVAEAGANLALEMISRREGDGDVPPKAHLAYMQYLPIDGYWQSSSGLVMRIHDGALFTEYGNATVAPGTRIALNIAPTIAYKNGQIICRCDIVANNRKKSANFTEGYIQMVNKNEIRLYSGKKNSTILKRVRLIK